MKLYGHFNPGDNKPEYIRGRAPLDEWDKVIPLPNGGTRPVARSRADEGPAEEDRVFAADPANVRHIVGQVELNGIDDNVANGKRFIDWMSQESKNS